MPDDSWITPEYLGTLKQESESHFTRNDYLARAVTGWKWYKKRAGIIPIDDFDDEEVDERHATSRDNIIKETVDEGVSIFLKNDPVVRLYPHFPEDADLVNDMDRASLSAWRNEGARSVVSSSLKESFIAGLSVMKVYWDVNKKAIAFFKPAPGDILIDPFSSSDKRLADCRYIIHKTRQRIDVVLQRYGTEAEIALGLRSPKGRKGKKATFPQLLSRFASMSKEILNRQIPAGSGGNSDEIADPFIDVYEYWIFPVVPNDVGLVSGDGNLDDAGYPYGVVATMIEDRIVKIKKNPFAGKANRLVVSDAGIAESKSVDIGSLRHPFICYDDETEVLSDHGWVKFKDLEQDYEVATINMEKQQLEWQLPISYITQHYEGDMITSVSDKKGANFSVTPNHRMVVYDRKNKKPTWKMVDAQYLYDNPQTDYAVPNGWKTNTDKSTMGLDLIEGLGVSEISFAKFLGLYIAEGYYHVGIRGDCLRITQKKFVAEVRKVIARLGVQWSEYVNKSGVTEFSISQKAFVEFMYKLCGKDLSISKRIPRDAFQWSNLSLRALLDGLILGDGTTVKKDDNGNVTRSLMYYTISKGLADDIQALACILGISSNIKIKVSKNNYTGRDITMYKICFHQSKGAALLSSKIEKTPYSGYVYCVTVPNGTVVVRRKGTPIVSGNCLYWDRVSDVDGNNRVYNCMGMVEQMIPMQFNIDAIRRQIYINAKTTANPGGLAVASGLDIDISEITLNAGEIIPVKDSGRPLDQVMKRFEGQTLPNYIFEMIAADGQNIKQRVGFKSGVTGQFPRPGTSHTPALTIGAVQEQEFGPLWEHVKELGMALEDMSVLMGGLMQQFYKVGDFLDVSEQGETRKVEWTQRHITANFRREVVAAATTSFFDLDKANRLSQVAAAANEAMLSENPDLIQSTITLLVNMGYPDAFDWIQQLRQKLQKLEQQEQELQALGMLGLTQQAAGGAQGEAGAQLALPGSPGAQQQPEAAGEFSDEELEGLEALEQLTGISAEEIMVALEQQ